MGRVSGRVNTYLCSCCPVNEVGHIVSLSLGSWSREARVTRRMFSLHLFISYQELERISLDVIRKKEHVISLARTVNYECS